MARISGTDLPREKRVEIGLTYIFGVGRSRSRQHAPFALEIDLDTKVRDLTDSTRFVRIRQFIDANYQVEGDLRRDIAQNIKRKIEIGSYQGIRHRRGLPGARTADAHECPYPQGQKDAHCRVKREVVKI